jgi:hypothetical protein
MHRQDPKIVKTGKFVNQFRLCTLALVVGQK